jgi:anti-sigma-K factor RskA
MRKLSADLANALSAEYVLGTLRGRARRRFEAIARADPETAAILRRWEDGVTPLAAGMAPVEPPARVWREIETRIAPAAAAEAKAGSGFWKAFGMVSGGLASVLLAFFLLTPPTGPRSDPLFVAVLTAPDSAPRMVVSMQAPHTLRVRMVKPWGGMEDKGLELWVLPKEGAPRSIGMVHNTMGDTIFRMGPDDPLIQDIKALAISAEPPGGSPTKQPTGPVLCSGMVAPVRRT